MHTETCVINRQTSESKTLDSAEEFKAKQKITEIEEEDTTTMPKLLLPSEIGTDYSFKREIVWFNAIGFLILHIIGAVGILMGLLMYCHPLTSIYSVLSMIGSGLGVTMGAHRLFSHRSYKAVTGLRIFLLIMQTLSGQNCLWVWVRDHRQHHKYSDTDADPHNASRGFFFSHVGWLMSKKHPKVIEYGKKIDMSDLNKDYWVMFQKKYYKTLYVIFAFMLPTSIPCLFWNESIFNSVLVCFFGRTILQLNLTWCVNSVAHIFGNKPYDKNILPVESSFVSAFGLGEGWHNYHHAFPWDYRAAELGMHFNWTTGVIDYLAQLGWVYDRKCMSADLLRQRILKTGDGSHYRYGDFINDSSDENTLRKYIVDKKDANSNLLMSQLEKDVQYDDFNNNAAKTNAMKLNCKKDFNLNERELKFTKASLNMCS